jgi:hypothetical protein
MLDAGAISNNGGLARCDLDLRGKDGSSYEQAGEGKPAAQEEGCVPSQDFP